MDNSLLNISQCDGNDFKPIISYMSTPDSVFISIIWQHNGDGKVDIWMAKDLFIHIQNNVETENSKNYSVKLSHNFPNPFNQSTKISYSIPKSDFVTFKIYDILGREVKTLINEIQEENTYSINFNRSCAKSPIKIERKEKSDINRAFGTAPTGLIPRRLRRRRSKFFVIPRCLRRGSSLQVSF